MSRVTLVAAFAAGGLGLVAVPLASSAATHLSPPPGAVVNMPHPVFRWTLPANEESDGLYLAKAPATTPEGKFFDENVVDSQIFFRDEREWAPTRALPAGRYWWNVWTHDRSSFAFAFSQPTDFSIPVSLRVDSVRLRRTSLTYYRSLDLRLAWRANVEKGVTVSARVLKGRRIVWSAREVEDFVSSTGSNTTSFSWSPGRRVKRGARVALTVTVAAQGRRAVVTRRLRAP